MEELESYFYNASRSEQDTMSSVSSSTEAQISCLEEECVQWESESFSFPISFQMGAHLLYNFILVLGLIGNGCVLLIFSLKKRPFCKLPTPLLANLAVGDLLITIFCLETGYISLIWQYWPFGKFLCFALSPVKPIAVFVSSYTLIVLSVHRYLKVKNPLHIGVFSRENVKWTIGVVWILAVCTSLPTGLFTSYEVHEATGKQRCGEYKWDSEMKELSYDLTLISLQFFAPLLVLIYTYTRISIVVYKNRVIRQRMSHGTSPHLKSLKTVRMSLMVVLGYVFAWLPYNVVALLAKYDLDLGESDHFPYIYVACHWLAMSHSVYNPIIYFWLNDSFRTTVMELFCRKKALERRRTRTTLFSWRTSNVGSSINRSSGSPLKQLRSVSESNSYPGSGSPLLKMDNKLDSAPGTPEEVKANINLNKGENE